MEKKINDVRKLVTDILNPNEQLVSLYAAGKSNSIYVFVLSDVYYYKVFRISDHRSHKTYRQPTFYLEEGEFTLRGQIREYLYADGRWYRLTRTDAMLMRLFEGAQAHHSSFYRGGRYQDKIRRIYFHRRQENYQYVQYLFDSQYSDAVEKLIFSGLFNTYRTPFGLRIYPTQFVEEYLKILPKDYQPTLIDQRVTWDNLDEYLTVLPTQPHQLKASFLSDHYTETYTISKSADQLNETLIERNGEDAETDGVEEIESTDMTVTSSKEAGPFKIFWEDIKQAFSRLRANLSDRKNKSFHQATSADVTEEKKEEVNKDKEQEVVQEEHLLDEPQPLVHQPKIKKSDPIKQQWEKNLENRHSDKMSRLLSGDSFDKLLALKEELPED